MPGSWDREDKASDRTNDDDEPAFSQDDDDLAGRSWPGMNSEIELEDFGRFEEDEDEPEPRTGRIDQI